MPSGPVVVLTRASEDNRALSELLQSRGIRSIDYPCIAVRMIPYRGDPLAGGLVLEDFDAFAFTSRRAVRGVSLVAGRIRRAGKILAALGEATGREVEKVLGRAPHLMGDPPTGEGLGRALAALLAPGARVFHPCGNRSRPEFAAVMAAAGMAVHPQVVYETLTPALAPLQPDDPALVVLTSPSAVEAFRAANRTLEQVVGYVAVGPTTAQSLEDLGCLPVYVAADPSNHGLLRQIELLIL